LLHPDVLGHLHILLNYEWDSKALLSIVQVGLPELDDRLALGAHKPLLSRLHARLHLDPVSFDDSEEYLRYRLQLAGCDKELFPRDTIALLHEASGGARIANSTGSLPSRSAKLRARSASSSSATWSGSCSTATPARPEPSLGRPSLTRWLPNPLADGHHARLPRNRTPSIRRSR